MNDFEAVVKWVSSLKSTEVSSERGVLAPSQWHNVMVNLPVSAYSEIGIILVEVNPSTVLMKVTPDTRTAVRSFSGILPSGFGH